jgi:hypothetical protein
VICGSPDEVFMRALRIEHPMKTALLCLLPARYSREFFGRKVAYKVSRIPVKNLNINNECGKYIRGNPFLLFLFVKRLPLLVDVYVISYMWLVLPYKKRRIMNG